MANVETLLHEFAAFKAETTDANSERYRTWYRVGCRMTPAEIRDHFAAAKRERAIQRAQPI